jgi:hypothetical protein
MQGGIRLRLWREMETCRHASRSRIDRKSQDKKCLETEDAKVPPRQELGQIRPASGRVVISAVRAWGAVGLRDKGC